MAEKKEYLSKEKYKEIQDELDFLRTTRRKEVVDQLEYAKSLGDLSENAEYHEARNNQAEVEDRINHLENLLANAEVVSGHSTDAVSVGSLVTIQKKGADTTQTYTIVGAEEADLQENKISTNSPIGEAVYGKKKGETVTARTPSGEKSYIIIDIK